MGNSAMPAALLHRACMQHMAACMRHGPGLSPAQVLNVMHAALTGASTAKSWPYPRLPKTTQDYPRLACRAAQAP
jgi:hypothetical protein